MEKRAPSLARRILDRAVAVLGAAGLTLAFFLVLPLIQAITAPAKADLTLTPVDTAALPPPPPVIKEEIEDEPEPEEEPPELEEQTELLDLSQLEQALNPGTGDGTLGAEFAPEIGKALMERARERFTLEGADQPARVLHRVDPIMTARMRKKAPGTVEIICIVDEHGRVQSPVVERSTDPAFEQATLKAVQKWRFEPAKRDGKPVPDRTRIPVTFPAP